MSVPKEDPECRATRRALRFSQPSTNLVGGTHPHPEDVRRSPERLVAERYARFNKPSTNLVGGTQPHPDDIRRPRQPAQAPGQNTAPDSTPAETPMDDPEFFTLWQEAMDDHSFSIPKAPVRQANSLWLGAGQSTMVAGLLLPDGLIYLGVRDKHFQMIEPSFIDIDLPVKASLVDSTSRYSLTLPGYQEFSPKERHGYLQWLANGRCDPDADIFYVLTFFFGLERRAVMDAVSDKVAQAEIPVIIAEVERLQALYGKHEFFHEQTSRLVDYLAFSSISPQTYLQEPPACSPHRYGMPLQLQIALGQMAVDKHPLNADWALAWALSDPYISRRTPVSRCEELFQRLFRQEYEKHFPRGLILRNNKARLRIYYHAMSPFLNPPGFTAENIADVTAVSGTRNKLEIITDECSVVLDPFSRYLGRYPDHPEALEGLLLLPVDLWPEQARQELQALQAGTRQGATLMSLGELSARFKANGALPRDKVMILARILETLSIGMEPDVLSGSRTPKAEEQIALFATESDDETLRITPDYQSAVVTLDLASTVMRADGNTSLHEAVMLDRHIDAWSHLCVAHRTRLKACLRLKLLQPPTLASLKKKLEPLTPHGKRTIALFLTHLAQADGSVTPTAVKSLERIYKALQLDPQSLYSDLHGAAQNTTSARTFPASGETHASPKVSGPGKPGSAIVLDMARVAQLQRETAEVSALLAKVFQDDPHDAPQPQPAIQQEPCAPGANLYGLDAEHSVLLRLLVSRSHWSRSDLEAATTGMDLMLDGALEHINDRAFDLFDMPICEGDDPIEINPDILSELTL